MLINLPQTLFWISNQIGRFASTDAFTKPFLAMEEARTIESHMVNGSQPSLVEGLARLQTLCKNGASEEPMKTNTIQVGYSAGPAWLEAQRALIEKARTGKIKVYGRRNGNGAADLIPPTFFAFSKFIDREGPSIVPESYPQDIEPWWNSIRLEAAEVAHNWPLMATKPSNVQVAAKGRPPKIDSQALEDALQLECDKQGAIPPDRDGPANWKTYTDVEKWTHQWLSDRSEEAGDTTVRTAVKKALEAINGKKGGN